MPQQNAMRFSFTRSTVGWLSALLLFSACLALLSIVPTVFAQNAPEQANSRFLPLSLAGHDRLSSQGLVVAALQCTNDTAGANDEPGQKDLTRLCVDYANAPTSLVVSFNFDEISVSGNNTLDACSLYDTDGDGNVNYALCVSTTDGSTSTTILYSCGDAQADRCTSPNTPISPIQSTCSVSVQNTDPFPTGADSPQDLEASCTVQLADIGSGSATLVDVCSYPSQQPNSDPSDCVLSQANTPTTTPTATATSTNTPTNTPTATDTPTNTPTATSTSTPPTSTPTPTNTPTATSTSTPPTSTPTPTNTPVLATSTPTPKTTGEPAGLDPADEPNAARRIYLPLMVK